MNIKKLMQGKRVEVNYLDLLEIDNNYVKDFRKRHNLTQNTLAKILNVSKKTIEKWEQGTNKVKGSSVVLFSLLDSDETIFNKLYSVKYK